MQSLTLSSYQPKKLLPCERARGFESQWNHLKTEDALPDLTAGMRIILVSFIITCQIDYMIYGLLYYL